MLDIGFQEILVLMVMALLVFGPDKLPDLGRRLGRAMREFRRASDDFRSTIETNLHIQEDSILPPSASVTPGKRPGGSGARHAGSEASTGAPRRPRPSRPARSRSRRSRPSRCPRIPSAPSAAASSCTGPAASGPGAFPTRARIAVKAVPEGTDLGLRACPVCDPQDTTG